ncbi:hypothetical protein EC957_008926 [Mortierella hygrophila]|uniref:Protein kinase domain-containing protein n=1 Tax=Mortierella hygrophila TaxID=979708 RepID=A0A9P6FBQ1_9FUNG|nr:hypothetical protein EC957_008926 [Mortierella hygrophila]
MDVKQGFLILMSATTPNYVKTGASPIQIGNQVYQCSDKLRSSLETLLEDAWKDHHSTKLSEEQAAPLMTSVVQVLHYLHTIDFVHQDIKLGNILIDDNGSAKLAGFGMSYCEQNGRKINDKVKAAYHASEMASTDALSPAIDAYAFEATLYQLLVRKGYDRQGWPDVTTESVSEFAIKVLRGALDPSPRGCHLVVTRATFRDLLSDDTDNVDDDDAEVEVAQDVEDAQAEEGDKGKEVQRNSDIAEAGEETAKDDQDTTNANIAEEQINDKDKKCLCTAYSSSDTDNDYGS